MRDIIIGIGASVGTALVFLLGAAMVRTWRVPKRVDRLEKAVVPVVRGVWALLRIHVQEHNGTTDPDVAKAYEALTVVVTEGVVSQKAST